jgi:hypothetical protein
MRRLLRLRRRALIRVDPGGPHGALTVRRTRSPHVGNPVHRVPPPSPSPPSGRPPAPSRRAIAQARVGPAKRGCLGHRAHSRATSRTSRWEARSSRKTTRRTMTTGSTGVTRRGQDLDPHDHARYDSIGPMVFGGRAAPSSSSRRPRSAARSSLASRSPARWAGRGGNHGDVRRPEPGGVSTPRAGRLD